MRAGHLRADFQACFLSCYWFYHCPNSTFWAKGVQLDLKHSVFYYLNPGDQFWTFVMMLKSQSPKCPFSTPTLIYFEAPRPCGDPILAFIVLLSGHSGWSHWAISRFNFFFFTFSTHLGTP